MDLRTEKVMLHNATVYFLIILYVAQTTDKALAQTSDIEEFFLLIDAVSYTHLTLPTKA